MLCLEAGKPVLCEKPFTVNAEQAKVLYVNAKAKKLFVMEAVWTRYFPLSVEVRKHITSGLIGEVLRVSADLSVGRPSEECFDTSHRMINKDLAGGCLLDLGIYSLTWVFQTLYHTLPIDKRVAPKVVGAAMTPEPRTGVDEMTTMLLDFPKSVPTGKSRAHAVATTALRVHFDPDGEGAAGPAVRIQGEKGEIQVFGPIYRPQRYRVVMKSKKGGEDHQFEFPGGGHGMFWEADEAARCLVGGKLESEGMSWEESTVIMQVMDEVRRMGGLTYPDEIETTKYPVDLKSKGL
jgi:predicted dehydrogenase